MTCSDTRRQLSKSGRPSDAPGVDLANRLGDWIRVAGLPSSLADLSVPAADLPVLADDAATQWTGTFNPRPFDRSAALDLYGAALWG